jgi:hypothetical protein
LQEVSRSKAARRAFREISRKAHASGRLHESSLATKLSADPRWTAAVRRAKERSQNSAPGKRPDDNPKEPPKEILEILRSGLEFLKSAAELLIKPETAERAATAFVVSASAVAVTVAVIWFALDNRHLNIPIDVTGQDKTGNVEIPLSFHPEVDETIVPKLDPRSVSLDLPIKPFADGLFSGGTSQGKPAPISLTIAPAPNQAAIPVKLTVQPPDAGATKDPFVFNITGGCCQQSNGQGNTDSHHSSLSVPITLLKGDPNRISLMTGCQVAIQADKITSEAAEISFSPDPSCNYPERSRLSLRVNDSYTLTGNSGGLTLELISVAKGQSAKITLTAARQ